MKHLTSITQLSSSEAIDLLDTADEMARVNEREVRKLPTLRGKTVVNLFYENSTRTKISFEIAAKRLSAEVIDFEVSSSSVSKGESLKDTAQTLEALGVDAAVVRHPLAGAAANLANMGWVDFSVINAGDGRHEHPTQALLDAMTMRESLALGKGANLNGVSVLIVGDIANSRVARSNRLLLERLGAKVRFAGPAALMPRSVDGVSTVTSNLDDALSETCDFVMMLRVQFERLSSPADFSKADYVRDWQLNEDRLLGLAEPVRILHPGPINRGIEISNRAADGPKSLILRQVANGVSVRMSVLYHLLGGAK